MDTSTGSARSAGFKVTRLSDALGAEISGLDASAIDADTFFAIKDAVLDHQVVRFRDCNLDMHGQVRIARLFGALELTPESTRKDGMIWFDEYPEMLVISNVEENGKQLGELGNAELNWHTDMAFDEVPPSLSYLRAIEVPPVGGDTWFANMYMAYDNLSPGLRRRVEHLELKHQHTHNGRGIPRYGYEHLSADDVTALPGPIHPIVRTHPETRKKTIYLGRRFAAYIVGLTVEDSEALLNELWAEAIKPEYCWAQQWKVGDMIIWDNRCVMHRRDGFPNESRRLMHRLVSVGSKPI
jgi:taurine dioxygenase